MAVYDFAIELIADYGCDTTEGPLWHEGLRALFWLDIPAGKLYRRSGESPTSLVL